MASSTIPPPRLARADPLVGSVINGKYRVVSLVASGGMGKIYRGEQLVLGRDVALKVLHAQSTALLEDPTFKKRFFLEASILSRLQHPNIVTLFDYGAIDGSNDRYFMAMEFLAGETLMRRIYERVTLTPKETVRIGKQIARGLSEAHAHGIVHRDLKPSNVMLVSGRDGRELVKVLDFGIVKVLGEKEEEEERNEELTQEGSFIGSPKYMAPEQITRGAKIDARTDVYSLGIILYQCLCGAVPFEARSSIETMMAHLNEEAIPLNAHTQGGGGGGGEAPEWLEQLVMACIEKDPDRRPATMELVARVLEGAEPTLSPPHSGPSGRFPSGAAVSGPDLASTVDDPQQTNRYPTSLRPPRPSARTSGAAAPAQGHGPGQEQGQGGGGSSASGRPSGSHPSGLHAITETGTAIGSLPPRESHDGHDTGTNARRVRMAPVMIIGAVLLGAVALLGERVMHGGASGRDAQDAHRSDRIADDVPKATFRLIVESTPPGADVIDGNEVLGKTPLSLAIDNGVARTSPRKLVLKRADYEPYAILQGPSDDNVRILATLVASAPAPEPRAPEPHVAAGAGLTDSVSAKAPDQKADPPVASKTDAPKPEARPDSKSDSKTDAKQDASASQNGQKLDIRLTR